MNTLYDRDFVASIRESAELLRAGVLRAVYHGSRSLRGLQELAHSYEALGDDTTRVMNRIKALYRGRGIDGPAPAVTARAGKMLVHVAILAA